MTADIKKRFEQDGIRRVKIGGYDIDTILRGKFVSLEKFWSIVEGGMGFCDVIFGWDSQDMLYDRSKVTGWHTGYPDVGARIDLSTYRKIPWEPNTAAFLLDFVNADETPYAVSPRQVLKTMVSKLERAGYLATAAFEFEFFIYRETPWDVTNKGHVNPKPLTPGMFGYSWLRTSQASELVHDLMDRLEAFEIPLEGFHTETGPGVFEAALRYCDPLTAADRAALFKTAVKEICHKHGLMASFMAKPANGLPGCSGHTHQALWKNGKNAFFADKAEHKMSATCSQYVAGQIAMMSELCALFAPNVNSYKRLLDGNWAPNSATWGVENRTCAVRMIPGTEKSTRIEHRLPAADVNPYLGLAAMLGAGLFGIDNELELAPPIGGNAYEDAEAQPLPTTLRTATEALDASERARELLGDSFIDHYVMTRDWEARQAEAAVTDWEIRRYFELA